MKAGSTACMVFSALLFFLPPLLCMGQDSSGIAADILAVLLNQQKEWNQGNIAGYMEGYWKSDSLLFTSSGKIQRGFTATLSKYTKTYSTNESMGTLSFSQISVYPLADSAAWVFGHWSLKREMDNPRGVFTLIFRRFSDGWKIIHDHTSTE